ncbi:MAG TPA: hypothetical protein VNZ86_18115, partial [Bacteroidia bacterium]|nr:hypothetical protein [Bacteroidia bacterium]
MGMFCVLESQEIRNTVLGRKVAFGFFLFWLLRLIIQFFGYSRKLWKGKVFETIIHVLFSLLWFYFSLVFLFTWHYETME